MASGTFTGSASRPPLSDKVRSLLLLAVKEEGSFNPNRVLPHFEEELRPAEADAARRFLIWCQFKGRTFGWNLPTVWAEWQSEGYIEETVQSQAKTFRTFTYEVVVVVPETRTPDHPREDGTALAMRRALEDRLHRPAPGVGLPLIAARVDVSDGMES